jgi:oligopeptide/dipeptide ABC transporter ATP-binding protein
VSLILEITNLDIRFDTPDGEIHAVKNVSLSIAAGECLGVVGESGSGKSQLFLGAFGLLAATGRATGSVRYRGEEILGASSKKLNAIRGSGVTMIFQDPLTALTPHMTVGRQIMEVLILHRGFSRGAARERVRQMLEKVRIPDAARRMRQYPHELSGGMRQRVMIAIATITGPDLIIADEPTTALDVTVQAQILEILKALRAEQQTAIALVSHNMGVIAAMTDTVQVLRRGEIVEAGMTDAVFAAPRHDYTRMLLAAVPRLDRGSSPPPAESNGELLAVDDLKVTFPIKGNLFEKTRQLHAVDGVSFTLGKGETLGIVGESGSGKSTLARAVLKLLPPSSVENGGRVVWMGRDLGEAGTAQMRRLRADMQIVFQDPLASLDPRMPVGQSIAEPLLALEPGLTQAGRSARVRTMMDRVGLDPGWINRYPHELSGGQNQRVGIARAMILAPRMVVCDEAVSALDVSIQAGIVALLGDLQTQTGLSLLFISHDLAVVRRLCHRVMVLYLGRVVELADSASLYGDPRHPYTRALLSAVLTPDPKAERARPRLLLAGDPPSPLDPKAQLRFLPSRLTEGPPQYRPRLAEVAPGHFVAEFD